MGGKLIKTRFYSDREDAFSCCLLMQNKNVKIPNSSSKLDLILTLALTRRALHPSAFPPLRPSLPSSTHINRARSNRSAAGLACRFQCVYLHRSSSTPIGISTRLPSMPHTCHCPAAAAHCCYCRLLFREPGELHSTRPL